MEKVTSHPQLTITHQLTSQLPLIPTLEQYKDVRNYLISELLLCNGHRSGIISGIVVAEVIRGRNDITLDQYHRLFISDHKTGFQQAAIIFMYPDVFQGLDKFVHFILPNIPAYLGKTDFPNADTQVFQRFDGFPVTSSEVTPLLRYSLKKFGLKFESTVTYFRRAAATLTGQISHHLAEKIFLSILIYLFGNDLLLY